MSQPYFQKRFLPPFHLTSSNRPSPAHHCRRPKGPKGRAHLGAGDLDRLRDGILGLPVRHRQQLGGAEPDKRPEGSERAERAEGREVGREIPGKEGGGL